MVVFLVARFYVLKMVDTVLWVLYMITKDNRLAVQKNLAISFAFVLELRVCEGNKELDSSNFPAASTTAGMLYTAAYFAGFHSFRNAGRCPASRGPMVMVHSGSSSSSSPLMVAR